VFSFFPALVKTLSDAELLEISFLENSYRKGLSNLEKLEIFQQFTEDVERFSEKDIIKRLGIKPEMYQDKKWLLQLPLLLKEGMISGMINEAQAKLLSRIRSKENHLLLIKQIYTGALTLKALEDRINSLEPPQEIQS